MPFRFQKLEIPEVLLIEARVFDDDRGYFLESYKHSDFAANGITQAFVQDNVSHSSRGVLRGLHFQSNPKAQGKLGQTPPAHDACCAYSGCNHGIGLYLAGVPDLS